MEPSGNHFDVIVVGAGIMGSCAAYEAAKRGRRVLLLEQFDFLHSLGSSHGESRTIRDTYPEPYYPSMVLESRRLWEAAQSEAGYRVLTDAPQLDVGPADNKSLQAVLSTCHRLSSLNLRVLDPPALAAMFSGAFRLPEGWIGVVSDAGGIIKPTKAVAMFQALALRRGAVLRDRARVTAIEKGDSGGVSVSTAGGEVFSGKKCVVTAGAWTRDLVRKFAGVDLPIQPLHTTICYWKIKAGQEAALAAAGGFPTFASYGDRYVYGTPSLEFPGLIKIALHGGRPCEPDARDWAASNGGVMVDAVRAWIEQVMPGSVEAGRPVSTQSCMYSMTPDGDFVIDFLGGELGEDVVVAGGFSGHGFKMGPLVGRTLAEMAIDGEAGDATAAAMSYFRIGRFAEDCRGNVKEYEEQVSSHVPP